MRKKILIIVTLFILTALPAQSLDIQSLLSQIGFNISSQKDPKVEITKVLEKQQNYANKKNYKKLKTLFTTDYMSFDGINLDEYIASIEKTQEMHSKLNFRTTINSITVNGDYATVDAIDTTDGITKTGYQEIEGSGILNSYSKTFYYLKKEDGEWKINADMVYSEKTNIKYGSAKELDIKLEAPECVKAGSEYNIKISADLPNDMGFVASISTEPIQYPYAAKRDDTIRPMKQDGDLERIVTSNDEGKNEIAVASIAIAKAEIVDKSQLSVKMNGIAFLASRVNVIPKKVVKNEQEK